jgi:hypothetical protein
MNATPQFVTPVAVTFPVDGREVTVLADLANLDPLLLERAMSPEGPQAQDVLEVLQLLAERPDLLPKFVATALGWKPGQAHDWGPAQVAEMLPDRVLYIAAVVLQVNADFFGRARPVLRAAGAMCQALLPAQASSSTTGPVSSAS